MRQGTRNISLRPEWVTSSVFVAVMLVLLPGADMAMGQRAERRHAALYFSDDTVLEGDLLLTPGRDFRLVDLSLEEGAKFNKVRYFNVDVISEMTFSPGDERYERHYEFADADPSATVTEKIFNGEPYPIRKPKCTVVFNSGEKLTGALSSTVIYLEEKDPGTGMTIKNRKFFLRSKQTGNRGQTLDDLVYITRIKMLDEGKRIERSLELEFLSFDAASASDMKALTQETLTGVPLRMGEGNARAEVLSTFGENVFLAARVGDRYVAGWPAEGTNRTELFEAVEEQFMRKQDYYNERKLLGILPSANGRQILTLASLRRQVPDNAVRGYPGWFEIDGNGEVMEFFRLSVWLWDRDPATGAMALADRGSFYRVRIDDKAETPQTGICPELWPIVKKDGKILVGGEKKDMQK